MAHFRFFFFLILMISCQEKPKEIQIFHFERDGIYPNESIINGRYVPNGERKEAVFSLNNFDFHDKKQIKKLDSLIKVSLNTIPYKDYQLFTMLFYQYGNDITEKTIHSPGTDADNETFNIQKLVATYSWEKGVFLEAKFYENGDEKMTLKQLE